MWIALGLVLPVLVGAGDTAAPWSASGAASPAVVINEVLYDPPGKDAGLEFVELLNRSGEAVALKAWKLETGNGAYEDRWSLEWTGADGDTLAAGGRVVIGEELVAPPPDFATELDLQNGPDACRLVAPDGSRDVVGWGEHTYEEYYEGDPVACPASGLAIGRDPDGSDTDRNAADFVALAEASPGGPNRPPCDLAVLAAGLSRHTPGSCEVLDFVLTVANLGTAPCGSGGEAGVDIVRADGAATSATAALGAEVAAGQSSRVVVSLANPGGGLYATVAWVRAEGDGRGVNDTLRSTLVLPPAPLVVSEVMFRPTGKDCEWIELANRSSGSLAIGDWTIEDSAGRPRVIAGEAGELAVEAGGFVVLVEDDGTFIGAYGDSAGTIHRRPADGWPTLNDGEGPLGFADAVIVRDGRGTVVDSMAYGAAWSEPGVSLERIDPGGPSADASNWSPHYGGVGGTPGRRNSVSCFLPEGGALVELRPSTFSPDGDGRDDLVAVSVRLPARGQVRLTVYDINGRVVRRLVDGDQVESVRLTFWDGLDERGGPSPVGVYIVAAAARLDGTGRALTGKSVVVLVRR